MAPPLVLCYHALSDRWTADLSTTPERFERQLRSLVRKGYRGVTFTEAVTTPTNDRLLSVTFDDAYRSVFELALPILDRLGIPATLYAPTDFMASEGPLRWPGIDQWLEGPYADELTPMNWDQLRELADRGWEIGSHTCSHPHLTRLDDARLMAELTRSKWACEERLERPCRSIAYPYGDVDARVVAATREAGYEAAAALPRRLDLRGPLEWPRVGVYHGDDDRRFALKTSELLTRLRRSPAWALLDGARRRLRP
jgi:peptidoglycan/xylan/chitin deacetylase (PgdA/CDA1 family)